MFFAPTAMPSTVVANMEYDPGKKNLRIRFVSGLVYEYLGVPAKIFDAMRQSGSKGAFLNQHIKGHYKYRKVD